MQATVQAPIRFARFPMLETAQLYRLRCSVCGAQVGHKTRSPLPSAAVPVQAAAAGRASDRPRPDGRPQFFVH